MESKPLPMPFTVEKAAKRLRVSPACILKACRDKSLMAEKKGNRWTVFLTGDQLEHQYPIPVLADCIPLPRGTRNKKIAAIYRLIKDGALKPVYIGRTIRIPMPQAVALMLRGSGYRAIFPEDAPARIVKLPTLAPAAEPKPEPQPMSQEPVEQQTEPLIEL